MFNLKNKVHMNVILSRDSICKNIITRSNSTLDFSPFELGKGNTNYLCGKCDFILLKNMPKIYTVVFVYRCPECNSFNELRSVDDEKGN